MFEFQHLTIQSRWDWLVANEFEVEKVYTASYGGKSTKINGTWRVSRCKNKKSANIMLNACENVMRCHSCASPYFSSLFGCFCLLLNRSALHSLLFTSKFAYIWQTRRHSRSFPMAREKTASPNSKKTIMFNVSIWCVRFALTHTRTGKQHNKNSLNILNIYRVIEWKIQNDPHKCVISDTSALIQSFLYKLNAFSRCHTRIRPLNLFK